ncbi:hypothetical protein PBF_18829 [Cytobacillus firmus DS1]|uniref:Uncharacterized protein n=1 Tax=Cytobacillus firmus DS1 TaxID=1307436 RepID=W7L2X0_CYTFI|nr:hypothetical protein PBF_18829 [Cytobacillus firmus DS1]
MGVKLPVKARLVRYSETCRGAGRGLVEPIGFVVSIDRSASGDHSDTKMRLTISGDKGPPTD